MTARFYFDLVDPISFLVERELRAIEAEDGIVVERVGVELRPAPAPLAAPDDPEWAGRWAEARALAGELDLVLPRPPFVPSSRKAHELLLHARADGSADAHAVRGATFRAFFREERDIGRVDVLVEIARAHGLDPTETKAVLDVDRYAEEVIARGRDAVARGVAGIPWLERDGGTLRGFHNRSALRTFLLPAS